MSVLLFIVILLVLILVHEFGHFIVAKKLGIRVDEFGIGFPPKALTIAKKNGTEYTLNWLPIGGFVRIFGETPDEESMNGPDADRSFVNKPAYVQFAVLVAGVVFNLLLAWILLSAMFMIGRDFVVFEEDLPYASDVELVASYVIPESPAADAGLVAGDVIVELRTDTAVFTDIDPSSAAGFISANSDQDITITIEKDGEPVSYTVTPEAGLVEDDPSRRIVGVAMGNVGFVQYTNPLKALWVGGDFTLRVTGAVFAAFSELITSAFVGKADVSNFGGPVMIYGEVDRASSEGIVAILFLTALISINLAIINILPIPALDGGRILFLIIETIKGSPIAPSVANTIHAIFFILLILLILVITYFDITRLFGN